MSDHVAAFGYLKGAAEAVIWVLRGAKSAEEIKRATDALESAIATAERYASGEHAAPAAGNGRRRRA